MANREHRVEALPVVLMTVCGLVALPALTFTTAWQLIGGLELGHLSPVTTFSAGAATLAGLAFLRLTWRELRGAIGFRIDDQGVHRSGMFGRLELPWAEIVGITKSEFGVVSLERSSGTPIRLCTYMFERRDALERLLSRRTGIKF